MTDNGPKILTLDTRFWSKVKRTRSCWEWQGSRDSFGYGMFRIDRTRVRRAHRLAYEAVKGPIADGLILLHRCDNPSCVRPSHLQPGTHADNAADRDRKGRGDQSGLEHGLGKKLTRESAAQIRAWASYGFKRVEIARWFHVSDGLICNVVNGKRWAAA